MTGVKLVLPIALLCLLAGCGSSDSASENPVEAVPAAERTAVSGAQEVDAAAFPTPAPGQALDDFSGQFEIDGPTAIAATSVFTPPESRLAFGLLDSDQKFAYGDTVVYVQRRDDPDAPIQGPFPAPADVLLTEARYRSEQAATETDPFAAIYDARIPVEKPGLYNVLVVSDAGDAGRTASGMTIQVVSKATDEVPDIGEPAPKVQTDTLASLKGNERLLTTRIPPTDELAEKSFADVVGKEPVALLFSTPQLCQSRVCGPVTDEMLQLKAKYGDDVTFIHQEVYIDNRVDKGLREPLKAFNLPSEPWLFTVAEDGTIAARLEGSIGLQAFEDAVKAALHK